MKKFVPATKEKLMMFCDHLKSKNIDAYLINDFESKRDSSLRYFSGHPEDAMLLILSSGKRILIPWDVIMASKVSQVEEIVDLNKKGGSYYSALSSVLKENLGDSFTLELQSSVGYFE
ncbi:hypothetical protein JW890_08740, partial [candidate division WOR-3 bacterium]|nr:hypothetical protein [candidate division WOR-3 bacterium]